jgi:energy-coupling factor transporter transmembrane protein EcfT
VITITVASLFLANQLFFSPCLLLDGFCSLADHLEPIKFGQVAVLNDLVYIRQQILLSALAILLLLLTFDALLFEIVNRLLFVATFV